PAPLAIWAFPEPRNGGRLRLNAFCGLNLAAHALGRAGKTCGWLYHAPDHAAIGEALSAIAQGQVQKQAAPAMNVPVTAVDNERARAVLAKLRDKRIGLIGEHPAGFDTCRYEPDSLQTLTGIAVEKISLGAVFDRAAAIPPADVAHIRADTQTKIAGLDEVDQAQLAKSFQMYGAFAALQSDHHLDALAVRCWPEMFTEFGCAACGPMGLMNENKVPCACEADVYGAVTALLLQELAGAPSYLVDVVDMDSASNTGVVWHCGSAPLSMADPETPPVAQIHSNRKMPLLQEFALKPGRVTVARLSQASNGVTLYIGGGDMLRAPKSFTGTSGVLRFDTAAGIVSARMMDEKLEHHVAIVYGDHRAPLRAIGDRLGIPVKELG
ncbi:MAG: L-fucose/L-arabinose isomerase family protein, partial [Beijerinckiaceae bacterium]